MHNKRDINWQEVLRHIVTIQPDYQRVCCLSSKGITLFGAGALGHEALQYFRNKGLPVHCFVDNSTQKHGTAIEGVPVVAIDHPMVAASPQVVIATKNAVADIRRQLSLLRYPSMSFDSYFVLDNFDRFSRLRNEVLSDPMSRRSLDGILLAMLSGCSGYCADVMDPNQYFCLPEFLCTDDGFVDAGAFVGDTMEKFIGANTGMFRHMYLFEPGEKQLTALRYRLNRLINEWSLDPRKITIVQAGLSDKDGVASFNTNDIKPAASAVANYPGSINATASNISLRSLDSFLAENPGPVTFIKSDIEGMELSMLHGAKQTIRDQKPKMAISTYHRPGDIFDIIELVRSLVPEYCVALRHHAPTLAETVLYFWIDP